MTFIMLNRPAICAECGFTTRDIHSMNNHKCEVHQNGGFCEDYPACGHEQGDCNGLKYGSDEAIKEQAMREYYSEMGMFENDTDWEF